MTAGEQGRRTGRVVVLPAADPHTGRTIVRAAVDVGDFLYEVIEALTDLHDQPGDPLRKAFDEVSRCHAEEIEAAGRPADERYWSERKREAMDELLSLADVAPDPSVLIGDGECGAIAHAHMFASLAPRAGWVAEPLDPWDQPTSTVHPFGEDQPGRAA